MKYKDRNNKEIKGGDYVCVKFDTSYEILQAIKDEKAQRMYLLQLDGGYSYEYNLNVFEPSQLMIIDF